MGDTSMSIDTGAGDVTARVVFVVGTGGGGGGVGGTAPGGGGST